MRTIADHRAAPLHRHPVKPSRPTTRMAAAPDSSWRVRMAPRLAPTVSTSAAFHVTYELCLWTNRIVYSIVCSGILTSPNYPEVYSGSLSESYAVVSKPGTTILLIFNDLDVRPSGASAVRFFGRVNVLFSRLRVEAVVPLRSASTTGWRSRMARRRPECATAMNHRTRMGKPIRSGHNLLEVITGGWTKLDPFLPLHSRAPMSSP